MAEPNLDLPVLRRALRDPDAKDGRPAQGLHYEDEG